MRPFALLLALSCSGCGKDGASASDEAFDGVVLFADDVVALTPEQFSLTTVRGTATMSEDGATLTGQVDYLQTVDNQVRCDADISLEGVRRLDHACEGCDFVFDIEAELIRDDGTDDCEIDFYQSFYAYDWDIWRDTRFAFADSVSKYGVYGYRDYVDVLYTGFSVVEHDGVVYPGPYYYITFYDGPFRDDGQVDYADGRWDWSWDDPSSYHEFAAYNDCHTAYRSKATEPFAGKEYSGVVACSHDATDGWKVWAEAGETLSVTVDDDADPSYPRFFVNGPDGCGVVTADGNYLCTGGGNYLYCPSAKFVAKTTGAYEIWIVADSLFCNQEAPYLLYVGKE